MRWAGGIKAACQGMHGQDPDPAGSAKPPASCTSSHGSTSLLRLPKTSLWRLFWGQKCHSGDVHPLSTPWRVAEDAVKVHNPWCPERKVLCSGPAMCFAATPAPREVCSPRRDSLMDVKGQSPQLAAEHHLLVTVCSLRLLQGSQTRGRTAWGLTQLPSVPGHPGSHLDRAVHAITLLPCQ